MALFKMRDSWNVWRRKVNEALGGVTEPIKAEDVTYDNTDSGLTATDVQSAVDEIDSTVDSIATTVGDATSGLVKDVADLKGKKFKLTRLFEGDASTGGSSGVSVTVASVDAFDALLIYYNAGNGCATIPVDLIKYLPSHLCRIQYIDSGNTVSCTVKYSDDTTLVVNAIQGSTTYLYGINYNA